MLKRVLASAFLVGMTFTLAGCASNEAGDLKITQDGVAKSINFWWPESKSQRKSHKNAQ